MINGTERKGKERKYTQEKLKKWRNSLLKKIINDRTGIIVRWNIVKYGQYRILIYPDILSFTDHQSSILRDYFMKKKHNKF